MIHLVSFKYKPGQSVYFISKNCRHKKGFIEEVNIRINNWHNGICTPNIIYTINGNEYKECELKECELKECELKECELIEKNYNKF